jgi:hypothetical protein
MICTHIAQLRNEVLFIENRLSFLWSIEFERHPTIVVMQRNAFLIAITASAAAVLVAMFDVACSFEAQR